MSRQLRQLDLALRIKVTLGTISRWERGECLPNLEQFRLLCLVLKVSADSVLKLPKMPARRRVTTRMRSEPVAAAAG